MAGFDCIAGVKISKNNIQARHSRLVESGARFRAKCGSQVVTWCVFECDCGKHILQTINNVKTGKVKSCGCGRSEFSKIACNSHGMVGTPEYESWESMKWRCGNPNAKCFKYYGGRGIRVCERWRSFENFFEDMGSRPEGTTLDRIDVNGDYEPGNCRWATKKQQMRNRTSSVILSVNGVSKSVIEWSEVSGAAPAKVIYQRIKSGWSHMDAVFRRVGS